MSDRLKICDACDGMSEKLSAEVLAQARALWDAVQNETRGVGIDDAGDLRSPKSHEDFERFVYRSWPRLLAHIATLQREADGLREALEPFAKVAEFDTCRNEADHDVFSPLTNNTVPHITIGDLRRAHAALSPTQQEQKGSDDD